MIPICRKKSDTIVPLIDRRRAGTGGYTLVELLVASAVLLVAIVAIIAVVRKGREMQVSDDYRRRARAIIQAKFESVYDFRTFNEIPEGTDAQEDTLVVIDIDNNVVVMCSTIVNVTSDTLSVNNGTPVPIKMVDIMVTWNLPGVSSADLESDTLIISKWVAKAKE